MEIEKKIYIAHGYGDRDHFKALYQKAGEYGYEVSEQIILSNRSFLGKIVRCILKGRMKEAVGYAIVKFKFLFLKNKILIVSLPAYDPALVRYRHVLEKNCCFFHSSHPFWDGSYYTKGHLTIRPKFEEILKKNFVGCFCVSDMAAAGLKAFFPDYVVIYHSIITEKYKKKTIQKYDKSHKNYVFLGRFCEVKNISLILQWAKENPKADITISFIGKGILEPEIRKAAQDDKRIILKGYYDKNMIQEELCNYDYLILPSQLEPLGIVLLEAMAAGVPCIVSNVSGPLSIIQEDYTGFFFNVEDGIQAFDNAMTKARTVSEEQYMNMSKNAIMESKKYDVEAISKKWFSLIEEKVNEYKENEKYSNSIRR